MNCGRMAMETSLPLRLLQFSLIFSFIVSLISLSYQLLLYFFSTSIHYHQRNWYPATNMAEEELKNDLQALVSVIVDEDEDIYDWGDAAFDKAGEKLLALRELKTQRAATTPLKLRSAVPCPEKFMCPISKDIMRDPVVLSTGQTYDRSSIETWLKAGNQTCPRTQQVLSHTFLTPNNLIRDMISEWCINQGMDLSETPIDEERAEFNTLIRKISSSKSTLAEKKDAAKELKSLTKDKVPFRAMFGECPDSISKLLNPLKCDPGLHHDIITTLANLSIHGSNKVVVANTPDAVPLLVKALTTSRPTTEISSNAAAAIAFLSENKLNNKLIGDSGAIELLIDLLEDGDRHAMANATAALMSLCVTDQNAAIAEQNDAVSVVLEKIEAQINNVEEGTVVAERMVHLLKLLLGQARAVSDMSRHGAVPILLNVMREVQCRPRTKEGCIVILQSICSACPSKLMDIMDEEKQYGILSDLAENGTPRAKSMVEQILKMHDDTNELLNSSCCTI